MFRSAPSLPDPMLRLQQVKHTKDYSKLLCKRPSSNGLITLLKRTIQNFPEEQDGYSDQLVDHPRPGMGSSGLGGFVLPPSRLVATPASQQLPQAWQLELEGDRLLPALCHHRLGLPLPREDQQGKGETGLATTAGSSGTRSCRPPLLTPISKKKKFASASGKMP